MQYADVNKLGQNFLSRFPESKYCSEILNTLGNTYYRQKDYRKAAYYWTSAIEKTSDMQQISRVRTKLAGILKYKLSSSEESTLKREFSGSDTNVLLTIINAEQKIERGELQVSRKC